jgi:hypothetical protein
LFATLLGSCSTEPPAATAAADDDCTLSTPLVPGIPGSPGHLIRSARNPNGDSELSHLMRRFVDDLAAARASLEAGEPVPKLFPSHRRMRCAWHTRPEERDATYDGMAQAYLAAVQAYDAGPRRGTYNAVVQGCIACHSVSCGGPLEMIQAMVWR